MKKKSLLICLMLAVLVLSSPVVAFCADNWGPWNTTSCYKGIQWRVRYNRKTTIKGKHEWGLEIRNRYTSKLYLSWELLEQGKKLAKFRWRTNIKPGQKMYRHYMLTTPRGGTVTFWVGNVRIGSKDVGAYRKCDNR